MFPRNVQRCFSVSPSIQAEIALISRMGSASLRGTVEAIRKTPLDSSESAAVLKAVCDRMSDIHTDMRYWDLVSILSVYGSSVPKTHASSSEIESVSNLLIGKVSQLSVKHLLDVYFALEQLEVRPQALHTSVCNRLLDIVGTCMYADELVALTRTLSRVNCSSRPLLESVAKKVISNESLMNQLRYLHMCEVAGGLGQLSVLDQRLIAKLESKCMYELHVMPIDELWKTVTGFPSLAYSHLKFEDMAVKKLSDRISNFQVQHFDQLTRPMDFFQFVRMRDLLTDEFVIEACKWANDAVYRPATRTQALRRPTIFEVALLADICRTRNIPSERIEKAIKITVTSKGGTELSVVKPKPLRYRRRRTYIREADGYASAGVVPLKAVLTETLTEEKKDNEAAFAPKLRASGEALWKSRSGPWFLRK